MIKRIKAEKGWGDIPVIITGGLGKVIGGFLKQISLSMMT